MWSLNPSRTYCPEMNLYADINYPDLLPYHSAFYPKISRRLPCVMEDTTDQSKVKLPCINKFVGGQTDRHNRHTVYQAGP